ncbi:Glycosyltransferase Family 90 domain containing protein [Tulasnella sp. 330]|nr:Glycosyltransferase Family 90 domain containing protein [Tulasnella sp. 330]
MRIRAMQLYFQLPPRLRSHSAWPPLIGLCILSFIIHHLPSNSPPPPVIQIQMINPLPESESYSELYSELYFPADPSSFSSRVRPKESNVAERFPPKPKSRLGSFFHLPTFESWRARDDVDLDWGDGDFKTYAAKTTTGPASQSVVAQVSNAHNESRLSSYSSDSRMEGQEQVADNYQSSEGLDNSYRAAAMRHNQDKHRGMTKKKGKSKVKAHRYRPDGLLEFVPGGVHPIYELIRESEKRWQEKLAKASTTLDDAVLEYFRRYHRAPPKGFEHWWNYVQIHEVQLPDEYDQIFHDIEPFWGMDPAHVIEQQQIWEHDDRVGSYTIAVEDGQVYLANDTMKEGEAKIGSTRANGQVDILREVAPWLPDLRATYTAHDVPFQFLGYDMRSEARDMAAMNEYIDPTMDFESKHRGWSYACPATSPIVTHNFNERPNSSSLWDQSKTFIWDHSKSMDPCLHPQHTYLNGFLKQYGIGPVPSKSMVPAFAISTTHLHADILTVAPEMWTENVGIDPVWSKKKHNTLLWRGRNTGVDFNGDGWNISQRIRLVEAMNQREGYLEVLQSTLHPRDIVGPALNVSRADLNDVLMDVGFAGKAIQCPPEMCKLVEEQYVYKEKTSIQDANEWKYILDVDGNGWSARFKRLMTTNSLIFKSTIFPEWFTDRVQPWVHFVPVKVDYTDLYDILYFFHGTHDGTAAHDGLAEKIATAGKEWSLKYWRKEDMVAYMLMLEYARVMSYDREEASFKWADVDGDLDDQEEKLQVDPEAEIETEFEFAEP